MADAFRPLLSPAYKISKAALNMLTVQYAQQYADDGFTFLAISPGVSQAFSIICCPQISRTWLTSKVASH